MQQRSGNRVEVVVLENLPCISLEEVMDSFADCILESGAVITATESPAIQRGIEVLWIGRYGYLAFDPGPVQNSRTNSGAKSRD